MTTSLHLTGYLPSVYTRAARMVLGAKGIAYDYTECDPFDAEQVEGLRRLHPFARVPVLQHGSFRLWETQAILDYVELTFEGASMRPDGVMARARMRQVMGIADSYGYWPLVRQAFSHGVFAPLVGEEPDQGEIDAGLAAAPQVLDALEEIAGEGHVLTGPLTLADCLLWPMIDYFRMVPEGQALLAARPGLAAWVRTMQDHPVAVATAPILPNGATP